KARFGELPQHLGDNVLGHRLLVWLRRLEAFLDPEGQEHKPASKRFRQHVVRVKIAQVDENRNHLIVESSLRIAIQTLLKKRETLHRVDRMHGPLQRKVHVGLTYHDKSLLDDREPLRASELTSGGIKIRERLDISYVFLNGLSQVDLDGAID